MVSSEAITAAVVSTSLISLAPNILLLLFPRYAAGEGEHSSSLALGQALAAGGLLGDVFLHTIPHASSADNFGLWILLGFAVFLLVDMLIRSFGGHSHGHSPQTNSPPKEGSEAAEDHHHQHHSPQYKRSTILLNLAADALHNFTDGLAIGASFASVADENSSVVSLLQSRGGLATLSILFHEIPVSTVGSLMFTVCCLLLSYL
jgi:zinc transporter 7